MSRQPDRSLDEAVKAAHSRDQYRAGQLIDYLITMPAKALALRFVVRVLEECRDDGANCPPLADELALRRSLAREDQEGAA